jgi:hypothetical protein
MNQIYLLDASIYNGLYSELRTGGIPSRLKNSLCSCKVNVRNLRSLSKSGKSTFKNKHYRLILMKIDAYIKNFFSSK